MEGQRGEVSCPRPDRPGLGGWELRSESPSAAATQEPCWQWAGFRGQEEEVRGEALFLSVYKCSRLPWHRCGWLKCMLDSALPLGRWEATTLLCNSLASCRGAARHCVVKGGAGMFGLSAGSWPGFRRLVLSGRARHVYPGDRGTGISCGRCCGRVVREFSASATLEVVTGKQ